MADTGPRIGSIGSGAMRPRPRRGGPVGCRNISNHPRWWTWRRVWPIWRPRPGPTRDLAQRRFRRFKGGGSFPRDDRLLGFFQLLFLSALVAVGFVTVGFRNVRRCECGLHFLRPPCRGGRVSHSHARCLTERQLAEDGHLHKHQRPANQLDERQQVKPAHFAQFRIRHWPRCSDSAADLARRRIHCH